MSTITEEALVPPGGSVDFCCLYFEAYIYNFRCIWVQNYYIFRMNHSCDIKWWLYLVFQDIFPEVSCMASTVPNMAVGLGFHRARKMVGTPARNSEGYSD